MIKRAYAVENIHEGQNSFKKFPHELNAMTDFTKFETFDQSIAYTKTKCIKLNTKTQIFLVV